MPRIPIRDTHLYYNAAGPKDAPAIVMSHGLLWDTMLFHRQVAALRDRYRVVCFDHRGQGRSEIPSTRSIAIETLTEDAVALIETLKLGPCHFVGLSMGGFVGLRVAIRRPDLLRSLVLLETSADAEGPAQLRRYRVLNTIARYVGLDPVADQVMPIMFGQTMIADPTRRRELAYWRDRLLANGQSIYRAVNGVIEREPVYDQLHRIKSPTLIIVGEEDRALPPEHSVRMHQSIAGSKLVRLPAAGHTSTIEQPAAVNHAMLEFYDSLAEVDHSQPQPSA